jgi:hypothetical protein
MLVPSPLWVRTLNGWSQEFVYGYHKNCHISQGRNGCQNWRNSKNLLQTCSCSSSSVRMFLKIIIIIITTPPLSSLLLDLLLLLLQHRWWANLWVHMRRQILCKFCTWFPITKIISGSGGSGCTPSLGVIEFCSLECCCYFAQQTDSPLLTSDLSPVFQIFSYWFPRHQVHWKTPFATSQGPTKTGTYTACKCR